MSTPSDSQPRFVPPFANHQAEIFLRGMAGERPGHPISLGALEREVQLNAEPRVADYVFGAGSEDTMRANLEAFRRWRIVPRTLSRCGRAGPVRDRAGHRDAARSS